MSVARGDPPIARPRPPSHGRPPRALPPRRARPLELGGGVGDARGAVRGPRGAAPMSGPGAGPGRPSGRSSSSRPPASSTPGRAGSRPRSSRRGHEVTVLAPAARPGCRATSAIRPATGSSACPVSATDGLPLPAPVRAAIARRVAAGARAATACRPPCRARPLPPARPAARPRPPVPAGPAPGSVARARRGIGGVRRTDRDRPDRPLAGARRPRRRAGRRTSSTGWRTWASPWHSPSGGGDGAAVVYDARDIYVDAANLARLPRPSARARRRDASADGRGRRTASSRSTGPTRRSWRSAGTLPLPAIVMNCSYRTTRPTRRSAASTIGWACRRRPASSSTRAASRRDRGIEQLAAAISARARRCPRPPRVRGDAPAELERAGRRPRACRPGPRPARADHAGRPAG